jgi:hypothetical protein
VDASAKTGLFSSNKSFFSQVLIKTESSAISIFIMENNTFTLNLGK